jgi:hypothetical protein
VPSLKATSMMFGEMRCRRMSHPQGAHYRPRDDVAGDHTGDDDEGHDYIPTIAARMLETE